MERVDDEWDRNPDAIDMEDLLFVTFDSQKTSREKVMKVIQDEGFEPKVR